MEVMKVDKAVREYFSKMGQKGGSASTPKKIEANKHNLAKANVALKAWRIKMGFKVK
jgi:hypothetical protein